MKYVELNHTDVTIEPDGIFVPCPYSECECTPTVGVIIGNGECHCCGKPIGMILKYESGTEDKT